MQTFSGIALQDSKGWEELKSEEGVLQKLLAEQNEELCGPRPERTTLGQIGGGSMNGHNDFQPALQTSDFMQLLQQSIEVPTCSWHTRLFDVQYMLQMEDLSGNL